MSEIGKVIDRVAVDALAAPLKAAGYRRTGRTWRRRLEDAVQVVHVQASRSNVGADGRFTLTAGVYFPALAARLALFPPLDDPAEHDCHVRTRPLPLGRHWWKVRAAGVAAPDPEAGRLFGTIFSWLDRRADRRAPHTNELTTQELREALERHALPWLSRVADLRGARDELARQELLWWAAAASLELGEHDEAAQLFARALEKPCRSRPTSCAAGAEPTGSSREATDEAVGPRGCWRTRLQPTRRAGARPDSWRKLRSRLSLGSYPTQFNHPFSETTT